MSSTSIELHAAAAVDSLDRQFEPFGWSVESRLHVRDVAHEHWLLLTDQQREAAGWEGWLRAFWCEMTGST